MQEAFEVEGGAAVLGDDQQGGLQVKRTEAFGQSVEAHGGTLGDAEFARLRLLLADEQVEVGCPRRERYCLVRSG